MNKNLQCSYCTVISIHFLDIFFAKKCDKFPHFSKTYGLNEKDSVEIKNSQRKIQYFVKITVAN